MKAREGGMRAGIAVMVAMVSLAASAEPPTEAPRCRKPFSLGPNKLVLGDRYVCLDPEQLRDILRAEKQEDYDHIGALLVEGCETLAEPMKASAIEVVGGGEVVRVHLYNKRRESMEAYTTKGAIIDAADADVDENIYDTSYAEEMRPEEKRAVQSICGRRWPKDRATRECCVLHETMAAAWLWRWMGDAAFWKNEEEKRAGTEALESCRAKWIGADLNQAQFSAAARCFRAEFVDKRR